MTLFNLWQRFVFLRNWHEDIEALYSDFRGVSGVYFIGCENRIIYIGQALNLAERSLVSLGNHYHRIAEIESSWSIALAPADEEDEYPFNELESTAIKKFAPIFNTSIPNKKKSSGKEPKITFVARVFRDQETNCRAFEQENLEAQAKEAEADMSPAWLKGNKTS